MDQQFVNSLSEYAKKNDIKTMVAASSIKDANTIYKAGDNIIIEGDKISATAVPYGIATTTSSGLMSPAMFSKLNDISEGANNYSLPVVNSNTLGGIKVGSNLNIHDGVLSAIDTTYTAGSNISILDGKISAIDTKYSAGENIVIGADNKISAVVPTGTGGGISYTAGDYGITNLISLQHEFTHALAYCNRYKHSGAISLLFTEGLADTLSQQISKLMNKNGISGSDWAKTIKLRGTTNWSSTRQSYISLALNSAATIIARTGDVTLAKGTKIWILLSKITDAMKNTKANIVFKQDDVFYDETNRIWYSVLLDSTVNVTVPKQVTETGAATFPTARPYCDWESYLYYPKRYSKDTDFDGDMCYSGGSMFLRFVCNAVIKGWDETYLINNYSKYQKIYGWPSNPYRTKKDTAAKKIKNTLLIIII